MAARPWKPDIWLVARFLDALWQPDVEHTRASLQAAARVNYDVFCRYVDALAAKGLISIGPGKDGRDVVRLTPRGLAAHRELAAWLQDVFGDTWR